MGVLWRMPADDERPAVLSDVTVAEVAEAMEASVHDQLHERVDKDVLLVYSVTAEHRAVALLLVRDDDSFIWRVNVAKPMSTTEFENWLGRRINE